MLLSYFNDKKIHYANYWNIWDNNQRQFPSINEWHNDINYANHNQIKKVADLLCNSRLDFLDVSIINRNDDLILLLGINWNSKSLNYSASLEAKFDFPFSISYQLISWRMSDAKYAIRIRVIWLIAAWLKQSTQIIPAVSWTIDWINDRIKKAIESFIISALFSSAVALVLLNTIQNKIINNRFDRQIKYLK